MSGLNRFISIANNGHANPDRAAMAEQAKVPTRKKSNKASALPTLASTAPPLGYASNDTGMRNTYPRKQYQQQQQQVHVPKDLFDDTATSGLESMSELTEVGLAYQQQGYTQRGEDNSDDYDSEGLEAEGFPGEHNGYPQRHVDGGSSPPTQQNMAIDSDGQHARHGNGKPAISGRFNQTPGGQQFHEQQTKLEMRPGQSTGQHGNGSRKRSRSTDHRHELNNPQTVKQLEAEDEQLQRGQVLTPHSLQKQEAHNPYDPPSEADSFLSSSHCLGPQDDISAELDPIMQDDFMRTDYDDETLSHMTYQQLKDQTWDKEFLGGEGSGPFESRFNQCILKKYPEDQEQLKEKELREFFRKLSVEEWAEAGDLFIGQFGEVMKKLREARKAKRAVVAKFEKEIEQRERTVRGKSDSIGAKLGQMKKGGEGVLKGKMV